jgi:CcmD family protein
MTFLNALQRQRPRARRFLAVVLLIAGLAGAAPAVPHAHAAQPPADKADEFVPVSDLPAKESLPAAPLVMAAYVVVWLVLMGYLFMLWRRLGKVEQEIAGVERQISQGRRS